MRGLGEHHELPSGSGYSSAARQFFGDFVNSCTFCAASLNLNVCFVPQSFKILLCLNLIWIYARERQQRVWDRTTENGGLVLTVVGNQQTMSPRISDI